MARWEFKLPDIGEGVTEGEIVQWLVHVGEVVKDDQPMVEVMTDKATVTIAAPKAGTILELRGKVGELVKVHSVLVVFDLDGRPLSEAQAPPSTASGTSSASASRSQGKEDGPAATAVGDIRESLPGLGAASSPAPSAYFNDRPLATPATRKTARDLNVDLRAVPPSGPHGRVTKADVESFSKNQRNGSSGEVNGGAKSHGTQGEGADSASALRAFNGSVPAREPVKIAAPHEGGQDASLLETRVPFAGMRRRIAGKMQQSKQTAAHFTFVEECDVGPLKEVRAKMKPLAEAQGVKLTYLPFIVKAVTAALKRHPILNSALDESTNELVYRKYYHIGIAASTDAGLMVPVVKHADRKSLLEIAREIERLATDAKAGKSKVEDLSGSTFTVTSLGSQGGLFATPIINFPEVGILGIHQIKEKPVVRAGQIVVGEVMLLSLSFDHRIVDGHVGAAFAYEVIHFLQNPDRLFLEMA